MDWLRVWHASVGSIVTGAALCLGVVVVCCLVLGFAQALEIVGGWGS